MVALDAPSRSVVALAYDGLCTFEFGVATELFGLERPELDVDWYDFAVVSVDHGPLSTIAGLTLTAPTDLSLVAEAGTVVVPGWRDPHERPPEALLDALVVAHDNGARLLSICSGVFVLAATGLLDGAPATTHWRYTTALAEAYPAIDVRPDVLFVDNGQVLTSAGSAAGIDLGLHLIRRDHGAEVANTVARRLVVPPQRSGGQAQFIDARPAPPSRSRSVDPAIEWALGHLAEVITVADLAEAAAMTPRTFARRFRQEVGVTPHRWLVVQRVRLAQRLLETTGSSIDQVAADSGFVTGATLRHHFQREVTASPSVYRARFRTVTDA